MNIIRDGQGRGYAAGVDDNNRLLTQAQAEEYIAFKSRNKKSAFVFHSPNIFDVTGNEGLLAWGYNAEESRSLRVEKFYIGWNGGTTNRNRELLIELYTQTSTPTANNITLDPAFQHTGNMNISSALTPQFLAYFWDNVGDGMVYADKGKQVLKDIFCGPGFYEVSFRGALIIPPQTSVAIFGNAEEAGRVSFQAHTWFEDVE